MSQILISISTYLTALIHADINLCPSCWHTTAAFRSFQPESQMLPHSPWRYTSTRPCFRLLPPTRRTRGPDRKKTKVIHIHADASTSSGPHSLRAITSHDSVKCHLRPAGFYCRSNGRVSTGGAGPLDHPESKHLFILSAVDMWHLNLLQPRFYTGVTNRDRTIEETLKQSM